VLPILEKARPRRVLGQRGWLEKMAAICQEKIATLNNIVEYTDFFFRTSLNTKRRGAQQFQNRSAFSA